SRKPLGARMRSTETKMETAIDVPRLRAVPAPAGAPDLDPSDETLLLRVADSDREAFELLYHRYVRSVLGQALRKLHDRAQSADAAQGRGRAARVGTPHAAGHSGAHDRRASTVAHRPAATPPAPDSPDGGPNEEAENSESPCRPHRALRGNPPFRPPPTQ